MKKERCVLTSVIETELDILKRHIHVLKTLKEKQPMGIIKLSELTKYPQHMVRYSLRIKKFMLTKVFFSGLQLFC